MFPWSERFVSSVVDIAMVASMDAGSQHLGYLVAPFGAALFQRQWRGKGAKRIDQRYTVNTRSVVRGKSQGLDYSRVKDLQKNNRLHPRKFHRKRKSVFRTVPRAPYNDNSFLMRVRRSGGLDCTISPAPSSDLLSSPAVSYHESSPGEDYGYGSMTGLIRLRPAPDCDRTSSSSRSNVENNSSADDMCVEPPSVIPSDSADEVMQRIGNNLSQFEMIGSSPRHSDYALTEARLTRQDAHIEFLENENFVMKERLSLIQQESNELRKRFTGGQTGEYVDESDDSQSCICS